MTKTQLVPEGHYCLSCGGGSTDSRIEFDTLDPQYGLLYSDRNFLELYSGILKFSLKVYFRLTLKIFQHAGKRNSEFFHFPCPDCKSALPQWDF